MGKLSQLFGLRKKEPESTSPLPNINTPLTLTPSPWEGNLPCVFSPTDGCSIHNPTGTTLFFDPLLFPPSEKLKPSGNHRPSTKPLLTPNPTPLLTSLPRDLPFGCLTSLPRVHKSVPYNLTFYHLHFLTSALRAGTPPLLSKLTCSATTGRTPALSWAVRPVISGSTVEEATLLLEYFLAFCVKADLGSWTPQVTHGRAVAKEVLIGSGYREFTPCAHTKVAFKSHSGHGKDHVRTAGVTFVVTGSDGTERKGEWKSEEEGEVEGTSCAKCYTDVGLKFEMAGDGMVTVGMQIHKDLGRGEHPGEEKWLSLVRGEEFTVQRQESDFGRMKRLCVDRDEELMAEAQEEAAEGEQGEEAK
ncbi:hypothetical protein B0T14DRAFT_501473 [Immersiella caudata]|uniref:Uncharacterized protein n=1 Tax=Immersiella caudata TaxID=314043 RepID=A0AA39XDR5_9PEZI|nr:hypothetical protein B0T14DRAFT_501473 [Immersiella caudata]